jgi:hypothetical protein
MEYSISKLFHIKKRLKKGSISITIPPKIDSFEDYPSELHFVK